MPRGKFLSYKGRSRQFTPVEELQREQELEVCIMSSTSKKFYESINSIEESIFVDSNNNDDNRIEKSNDHVNGIRKLRKLAGAVDGLIEISNPNRPLKKSPKSALLIQEAKYTITESSLEKRIKEKPRPESMQKATSEATADLARLAIVRKKREAAAEQRLAAKRENNNSSTPPSTPRTSKTQVSLKKNNKYKSSLTYTTEFLKKVNVEEHASKLDRGRNGHKRMSACKSNPSISDEKFTIE